MLTGIRVNKIEIECGPWKLFVLVTNRLCESSNANREDKQYR